MMTVKPGKGGIVEDFTYASAKGFFMDCSFRVEMAWPDSIEAIDIESLSMIGKKMEQISNPYRCY